MSEIDVILSDFADDVTADGKKVKRVTVTADNTFVMDFINNPADIQKSFERYYKTTVLSGETDANKFNDLIDNMESMQVVR